VGDSSHPEDPDASSLLTMALSAYEDAMIEWAAAECHDGSRLRNLIDIPGIGRHE